MGLPAPDYFNVNELVERWQELYGKCTCALVERYISTGKLKAESVYEDICMSEPNLITDDGVKHWTGPVVCWQGNHVDWKILLSEVQRFEAENPPTNVKCDIQTNLHPKEKASLLKLLAVFLGTSGFAYDPSQKKSTVPAEIQKEAEELGISIDVDTIRKWLKEAVDYLPRNEGQAT